MVRNLIPYILFLGPKLLISPFPPFSPSLISLEVSVDVEHHVILTYKASGKKWHLARFRLSKGRSLVRLLVQTTSNFKTVRSLSCLWLYNRHHSCTFSKVSRFGLAVRCLAGKQRNLGLNPLLLSLQKLWSVDTVLWLCPSQLWNIKMTLIAAHLNAEVILEVTVWR